ncbi:MAG TPA: sulfatase/phosphatase domain-containing protein [Bryobacteraceae bacterium]|nr:sulfatase/phosphatase domain-containing protein [Bryobacteraceae bacterium]
MLGDHGLLFKGAYMYDPVVRVPLILRAPGTIPADRVVDSLVEEVEILPTLLDLLGVKPPQGVQGKSLLPVVQNPNAKHRDAVFAEFPTIKMARTREWKLVHYTHAQYGELYHLSEDPYELTNLYHDPEYAPARMEMLGMLFDWFTSTPDPKLVRRPDSSL